MMAVYFDDLFDDIGHLGRFQWLAIFLTGLAPMIPGYQNFIPNFIAGQQDHWCKIDALLNYTAERQKYIGIPKVDQKWSKCKRFDLDFNQFRDEELEKWNRSAFTTGLNVTECDEYVFDTSVFTSTIQMQYGLVCSRYWMVPLVTTIYLVGHFIGALFSGILADRFGRRPVCLGLLFTVGASALAAPFSPNYVLFVLIRLVCGACGMGLVQVAYVIMMETLGPRWRVQLGMFFHNFFALAFVLLPGVAYLIRDHIKLQVVLAIPPFVFCILHFLLLKESPRWLMSQGRYKECRDILQYMANMNKASLPDNLDIAKIHQNSLKLAKTEHKGSLFDLFRTPNLRKRTFIMGINWFATSLGYYGLSYSAGVLPGGVFLNTFIAGAVQLPANALPMWIVPRYGRKLTQILSLALAGVLLFAALPFVLNPGLPQWIITTLAMTGKFLVTVSFAMVYLYGAELYPTVIRSNGIGFCSMCARVGGMASPQVKLLGTFWNGAPFVIFGIFPLLGGMLSVFLPETKGCKLPETIAEGESFPNNCHPNKEEKDIGLESENVNEKTNNTYL